MLGGPLKTKTALPGTRSIEICGNCGLFLRAPHVEFFSELRVADLFSNCEPHEIAGRHAALTGRGLNRFGEFG